MSKTSAKTPAPEKVTESTTPAIFEVAKHVKSQGFDDKPVRGRLRKIWDKAEKDNTVNKLPKTHVGASRWTFAAKDRDAVIALIGKLGKDDE